MQAGLQPVWMRIVHKAPPELLTLFLRVLQSLQNNTLEFFTDPAAEADKPPVSISPSWHIHTMSFLVHTPYTHVRISDPRTHLQSVHSQHGKHMSFFCRC